MVTAQATDLSGAPKRIAPGLDAVEVDADAAMAKWRSTVEAFDAESFASRYGALGVEAVRALGVDEFVELLANPPPGIDEIVALADVLRYADDDASPGRRGNRSGGAADVPWTTRRGDAVDATRIVGTRVAATPWTRRGSSAHGSRRRRGSGRGSSADGSRRRRGRVDVPWTTRRAGAAAATRTCRDRYDRVVVDTAPTGHALRLLDLPDFCGEFVGRLVSLRDRVGSLATLAGAYRRRVVTKLRAVPARCNVLWSGFL